MDRRLPTADRHVRDYAGAEVLADSFFPAAFFSTDFEVVLPTV